MSQSATHPRYYALAAIVILILWFFMPYVAALV